MMKDDAQMCERADALVGALNGQDSNAVLRLFTPTAVIDDPSTGDRFEGHKGVRDYFERFFVGYRTRSRILAVECPADDTVRIRVDFTGDFGHEIGRLDVGYRADGLIHRMDADLE